MKNLKYFYPEDFKRLMKQYLIKKFIVPATFIDSILILACVLYRFRPEVIGMSRLVIIIIGVIMLNICLLFFLSKKIYFYEVINVTEDGIQLKHVNSSEKFVSWNSIKSVTGIFSKELKIKINKLIGYRFSAYLKGYNEFKQEVFERSKKASILNI